MWLHQINHENTYKMTIFKHWSQHYRIVLSYDDFYNHYRILSISPMTLWSMQGDPYRMIRGLYRMQSCKCWSAFFYTTKRKKKIYLLLLSFFFKTNYLLLTYDTLRHLTFILSGDSFFVFPFVLRRSWWPPSDTFCDLEDIAIDVCWWACMKRKTRF